MEEMASPTLPRFGVELWSRRPLAVFKQPGVLNHPPTNLGAPGPSVQGTTEGLTLPPSESNGGGMGLTAPA